LKNKTEIRTEENKNLISAFRNTYEDEYPHADRKLEDLSIELSEYGLINTDFKSLESQTEFKKLGFDSSMAFIDRYLEGLLGFLDEHEEWKEMFIDEMKTPSNVSLPVLLKNLGWLT
jgi:hypothetical protein